MSKIPFKVSARTAKLIGLENFSNEEGAIIELVKNTYDADSTNCLIIFDLKYDEVENKNDDEDEIIKSFNKSSSNIYILDNGHGMLDDIIQNQWMTIGTDDKLYDHLSVEGRVKTGAKGIGRFALNRLGLLTDMYTLPKGNTTGYHWKVNWSDFDRINATVSEVNADLESVENLNLKTEIEKEFSEFEAISNFISKTSFKNGTLIKISELNDNWDNEKLEHLFSNLEVLLPPKEQSDFQINFYSTNEVEKYGKVNTAFYDDYDYKVEAKYLGDESKSLILDITRSELNIVSLESRFLELFDYPLMQNSPYRLEDIKKRKITIKKTLSELLPNASKDLINSIGKFDFTFYFLKNTRSDDKDGGDIQKYPYKDFNSANRKAWLKRFGGVKIFRDDFRIRPYGENGEDWLKLGERQAQSPGGAGQKLGGYRIRPNQISGTINISRIYNLGLQDKSGREGLQENDEFDLFKNIVLEIISLFEKDRNHIMYHLSELYKKRNKEAEAKRKAQEEAERVKKEKEKKQEREQNNTGGTNDSTKSGPEPTERESTLADGIQILSKEIEEKDEEIRLLRNLASVGLIISSFAHEVKSLRSRLLPRTSFLLKELKTHLDEKKFAKLDKNDNPFYMIKLIQEEDTKLKHWLDYSLSTLKRDKRERTNLNFADYFESFKSTWGKALEQRNIKLVLTGDKNSLSTMRAFEVDMDSIFNNLLSNSLSALKGVKVQQKTIEISWKKNDENIEIIFSDNGKGLNDKYKDNPDEIFKLLESSKTDRTGNVIGTGLGLYIVKSIIEEYNNSSISILDTQNGFSLRILFKTRKTQK